MDDNQIQQIEPSQQIEPLVGHLLSEPISTSNKTELSDSIVHAGLAAIVAICATITVVTGHDITVALASILSLVGGFAAGRSGTGRKL